ncbi:MAG: LysE family translocator [Hyphomicrobiales bacterium]
MTFEIWLAFTITSLVILIIPGPTVIIVVSYALGRGRSSAWATVPGVALGDFVAMTISLLGAGAVLAASATAFNFLKLVGACYLVWLGVQLWRSEPDPDQISGITAKSDGRRMFFNSFAVTALNPKSIVFFVAFVPQFIVSGTPLGPQFVILIATFVALAALNVLLWAVLVGFMRSKFQRPETLKLLNRLGGSFLVGAGLFTAFARRTAAS